MTIHSNLNPLSKAPAYDWPGLPELASGGFATVRDLGATEVLKLTCCEPTNTLLRTALTKPHKWPAAFPRVYECLGPQAVDSDGIEFTGWRIERLFHLNDKHAAVIARSASIRQRMAVEPAAAARGVEPNLDGLEALTSVIDFCAVQPDEHWTQDAVAALVLASACDGELREGFLSLWAFIREHRVKLDIGRQANILMDCFGRLRLADPVTMRLEADGGGLAASPAWLATQLPVRQRGFRVAMTWVATPFRSSASAAAAQRLLKARAPSLESHLCDEQAAVSYLRRETVDEAFRFGSSLSELMSPTLRSSLLQQAELH